MTPERQLGAIDPLPSSDPRETNSTAERNEMRRQESTGRLLPGIVDFIVVLMLGFMLFSGDPTPEPNRLTSTQTPDPTTLPNK